MKTDTANPDKKSSLLDRFKDTKPEGGLPQFRFATPGDAIVAKFLHRRTSTNDYGVGKCLDVEIIECSDNETIGPHTIYESTGITNIFDHNGIKAGDWFYLRFHEINRKSGYKRFAFALVDVQEKSADLPSTK